MAVHLNGIDVNAPPAMKKFFGFIFKMVTFDYLPVDTVYDAWTEKEAEAATDALGDIGYDAISIVRNMGSVFVALVLIPIGIVILWVFD